MVDEVEDIQPHRSMPDELSVGSDILQVTGQTKSKEHSRIEAFLSTGTVVWFCFLVQEMEVEDVFEPSIEVVFRDFVSEIEGGEEFGL